MEPPKKRNLNDTWTRIHEERFREGFGTFGPHGRRSDNTEQEWLEKYLVANTLPNLVFQPWRSGAIRDAMERLEQLK